MQVKCRSRQAEVHRRAASTHVTTTEAHRRTATTHVTTTEAHRRTATTHVTTTDAKPATTTPPTLSVWSADSKRGKHEHAPSPKKTIEQSTTTEKGVLHSDAFLIAGNFKQHSGSEPINNELKQRIANESHSNDELRQETGEESQAEESQVTDVEMRRDTGKNSIFDESTLTYDKLYEDSSRIFKFDITQKKMKIVKGKDSLLHDHSLMHGELKKNHSNERNLVIINQSVSSPNELISTSPPPLLPTPPSTSIPLQVYPTDAKNGVRSGITNSATANHIDIEVNATAVTANVKRNQTHHSVSSLNQLVLTSPPPLVPLPSSSTSIPLQVNPIDAKNGVRNGMTNSDAANHIDVEVNATAVTAKPNQTHQKSGPNRNIVRSGNTDFITTTGGYDQTTDIGEQMSVNDSDEMHNINGHIHVYENYVTGESKDMQKHEGTIIIDPVNTIAGVETTQTVIRTSADINTAALRGLLAFSEPSIDSATRNTIVERRTDVQDKLSNVRHKVERHVNDETSGGEEMHKTDAHDRHVMYKMDSPAPSKDFSSYKTNPMRTENQIYIADLRKDSNQMTSEKINFYKNADDTKLTKMMLPADNDSTSAVEFATVIKDKNGTVNVKPTEKNRKFLKQAADTDDALFVISKDVNDENTDARDERMPEKVGLDIDRSDVNKYEAGKPPKVIITKKHMPTTKLHTNMRYDSQHQRMESSESRPPSKQVHVIKNHVDVTQGDAKYGRNIGNKRKMTVQSSKQIYIQKDHAAMEAVDKHRGSGRSEGKSHPDYAKPVTRKPTNIRSKVDHPPTIGSGRRMRVDNPKLPTHQAIRRISVSREFIRSYSEQQHNGRARKTTNIGRNNHKQMMRRDEMDKEVSDKRDKTYNSDIDSFEWHHQQDNRFLPTVINSDKRTDAILSNKKTFPEAGSINDEERYDRTMDNQQVNIDAQLNYNAVKNKVPLEATIGVDRPHSDMYSGVINVGTDYEVLNNKGKYKPVVHEHGNDYKTGFENGQKINADARKYGMPEHGDGRLHPNHRSGIEQVSQKQREGRKYYIQIYPDNFGSYDRQNPYEKRYRNNHQRPINVSPKRNDAEPNTDVGERSLNGNFEDKPIGARSGRREGLRQIWQNPEEHPQRHQTAGQKSVSAAITRPADDGHKRRGHPDMWWWRLVENAMKESQDDTSGSPLATQRNTERFNDNVKRQRLPARAEQELVEKKRHGAPNINVYNSYDYDIHRDTEDNIDDAKRNFDGEGGREFGLVAGEGFMEEPERDRQDNWPDVTTEAGGRMESITTGVIVNRPDVLAEQGKPHEIYCSWIQESTFIVNQLILDRIFFKHVQHFGLLLQVLITH